MAVKPRRAVIVVLDGVGVGSAPDAEQYGDDGAATLPHILELSPGLKLPNFESIGLFELLKIPGATSSSPQGAYGKMVEISAGKDTTTGHWELSGLVLDKPFPTYPHGFPAEIIDKFQKAIGRGVLGNYPASGTEIIQQLGEEHLKTGCPIVYTSADSVFQIAAHEDIIPVAKLYEYCQIARKILQGPHGVGRVIARPFQGEPGNFQRTERRRDFSLKPIGPTVLDRVREAGFCVHGVGKIEDIFAGQGLTSAVHTKDNTEGITETINWLSGSESGLLFVNLVDFDMKYGHRNDISGFARALKEVDDSLPKLLELLTEEDLLIITADHGCDPAFPGTDHTREMVPLLVQNPALTKPINLGIRATFADVAATVGEWFNLPNHPTGTSFLTLIREGASK